jgi:hypothetical protein
MKKVNNIKFLVVFKEVIKEKFFDMYTNKCIPEVVVNIMKQTALNNIDMKNYILWDNDNTDCVDVFECYEHFNNMIIHYNVSSYCRLVIDNVRADLDLSKKDNIKALDGACRKAVIGAYVNNKLYYIKFSELFGISLRAWDII